MNQINYNYTYLLLEVVKEKKQLLPLNVVLEDEIIHKVNKLSLENINIYFEHQEINYNL